MSGEREKQLPEEFAFNLDYANEFLAVRVDKVNGESEGKLIAHGEDADKVHAAIRRDRKENPDSRYHFFSRADHLDRRDGWLIGGEE